MRSARLAFGIPGTTTSRCTTHWNNRPQVTAVWVTDEQSAGFMATGVPLSESVGV